MNCGLRGRLSIDTETRVSILRSRPPTPNSKGSHVPSRPSSARTSSLDYFICRDSEFSKLRQGYKLVLSGETVSKDRHTVRVTVCWDTYQTQSCAYVDVWSQAGVTWNRVHALQPPTFYPHMPSAYKRDADHQGAADTVAAQLLQHAKWVLS